MSVKEEIYAFCEKMNTDSGHMEGKDLSFQVNLKESGPIQMVIKDAKITVYEDCPHTPELTLTISDDDYSKLLKNQLNTTVALMTGKVKVDRVDKALKLLEVVKQYY
ncbi:SCP2 sterol-binding domain-containing protein [Desulfitobacterium sp. THU1]|uniref:SCP2 sterol-binding domain-containing protein n=1 Tax=Desulfitobacterium sp. THU1 TaxID=3138072 RepID=UPI0031204BF4